MVEKGTQMEGIIASLSIFDIDRVAVVTLHKNEAPDTASAVSPL